MAIAEPCILLPLWKQETHDGTNVPECVSCFHKGSKIHGSVIAIRYGASLLFRIITTLLYTTEIRM